MLSKILDMCENLREDIPFDNIPKDYYFELKYEEKVIIRLVKIYQYHNDKGKIRHKKVYGKVEELNMSLKEYCNLLFFIYEGKLMIGGTGDIRTEGILKKIKILKIN